MNIKFIATLSIIAEISDEDFSILWINVENHYDFKVYSLCRQGGKLFGARNIRAFRKTKEIEFDSQLLQLSLKALEFSKMQEAQKLSYTLFEMVHELRDASEFVNITLQSKQKSL